MNILRNIPDVIKQYLNTIELGQLKKPCRCEVCSRECNLWWHDEYIRKVITLYGVYEIPIKRLYCPFCKHAFALIPEFIKKFYRYARDVIGLALKELKKLSHKKVADKIALILDTEKHETFIGPGTIYNWQKKFGAT